MSDDEGEAFDVDEEDFRRAMNPGAFRGRRSKKQEIYGVFGGGSSSEEEAENSRPSFGGGNRGGAAGGDPAKGIRFVSGGSTAKKDDEIDEKVEPSTKAKLQDEDDEAIVINFKRARKAAPSQPAPVRPQKGSNSFAGMRGMSGGGGSLDVDWTQNSSKRDVLMKMMQKMGYKEGEGLGAKGQGIVAPIEVKVRPGRGALGSYGPEAAGPKFGESAADAQKRIATEEAGGVKSSNSAAPSTSNARDVQQQRGGWRKNAKVKVHLKTYEDVVNEGGPLGLGGAAGGASSNCKVIDMTGREQRVYSGYDAFSIKSNQFDPLAEESGDRKHFDMPELTHNLRLLTDMTEHEIRRVDHHVRTLKDENIALEHEEKELERKMVDEKAEVDRLAQLREYLSRFSASCGTSVSLDECRDLLCKIRTDWPTESAMYQLDSVALSLIMPLMRDRLSAWNPLEEPEENFELMDEWKALLSSGDDVSIMTLVTGVGQAPAFDRLVWEAWMPVIRRAAGPDNFRPKQNSDRMRTLIAIWRPLLPTWIADNLMEQILIPRLQQEVDSWDPVRDPIPIDGWLVPWHEVLGDQIQPLYAPLRQKLAQALRLWNPTDSSALAMLRPWQRVWQPATFSAFIAANIIPKLELALAQMDLDPSRNLRYDAWFKSVQWLELIGVERMTELLCRTFFPRWYGILCTWLRAPGMIVDEVKRWFQDWKQRFPALLLEQPAIVEQLRQGLIAISQALQGLELRRTAPSVVPPSFIPPPPQVVPPPHMAQPPSFQLTTRELLERVAQQHNMTFIPQPGRLKDGKQVYWFGSWSVFTERDAVFAFDLQAGDWLPITIDRLLLAPTA